MAGDLLDGDQQPAGHIAHDGDQCARANRLRVQRGRQSNADVAPQLARGRRPRVLQQGAGIRTAGDVRCMPTTAFDQYLDALAKWLGLNPNEIAQVLSDIGGFATADLRFMR